MSDRNALTELSAEITACRKCPRLVKWREEVALKRVKRFADEQYWGKPVPGFGDAKARVLVVGLAPAAHGANRTGRMFTGDNSGVWLYRALHRAGFASQSESISRHDGMKLHECYITAAVRCAPPLNKPTRKESGQCSSFLMREIELLRSVRVVVGLGKIGFDAALKAYRDSGRIEWKSAPKFGHGVHYRFDGITFIGSYHPSQQNTFTGRLTEKMLDDLFSIARKELKS